MEVNTQSFITGQIIDNKLFYSSSRYNGLFSYDLITGKVSFINSFNGYPINVKGLHSCSCIWNNKIVFLPLNGKDIHIFDVESKEITSINISESNYIASLAKNIYIKDSNMWVIPRYLKGYTNNSKILCVDLTSYKVVEQLDINKRLESYAEPDGTILILQNEVYDNKIWIPICRTNNLVSINPETKELTVHSMENMNLYSITSTIDGIWVSDLYLGKAKKYNGSNFIGDINLNYAEIISSVIETKEYCVALLRNQNRVVLISKQSGESKRYILSSSLIGNGTLRECSLLFSKWKEIYVVFPNDRNTLFEIIDNNDYEEVKIEECKDLNILIDDFNQKEPILEGDIGLGCYIKLLVKDKHER